MSLVDPKLFAADMKSHLEAASESSNWSNPEFTSLWSTLCTTLNRAAAGDTGKVLVVPACLGSGKSEGLKLYLSKLQPESHPGALVVVELRETATRIAAEINLLTGRSDAVAYHGDSDNQDLQSLRNFPVLVICHAAFELATERVSLGDRAHSKWYAFTKLGREGDAVRKLIVVDEAPDLLREAHINLATAQSLLGALAPVAHLYPDQLWSLDYLTRRFRLLERRHGNTTTLAYDGKAGAHERFQDLDMSPLINALPTVPASSLGAPALGSEVRAAWESAAASALRDIPALVQQWHWYERAGINFTLHTARCILPADLLANGFVILDGTAKDDVRYEMLGDAVEMIDVPTPRTYRNVRLVLAIVPDGMGKGATSERAETEAPYYLARIQHAMRTLPTRPFPFPFKPLAADPRDRRVFVLTNKAAEPAFKSDESLFVTTSFKKFAVAHYGETGGTNVYRDFDTCAIYGLQYPPSERPINLANARQVQPPENWQDGKLGAIRWRGEVSHIYVSLSQGQGRVRSRIVINEQGDCAETDLFLLLSDDTRGVCKAVLKKLHAAMPGLENVVTWDYRDDSLDTFTDTTRDVVLDLCARLITSPRVSADVIWSQMTITKSQKKERKRQLKKPGTLLYQNLAALGITYHGGAVGQSNSDYFTRKDTST